MAERDAWHTWASRGLFAFIALGIMFFHLLPLETTPRGWAAPDLMLATTIAWTIRRPDHLPVLLVALLFLIEDLLYQRPPGLWPALMVLLTERLRLGEAGYRTMPFLQEWFYTAFLMAASVTLYHVLLSVFFVDRPPLGLSLFQTGATILFYPAVVGALHFLIGIRKLSPGESETSGVRS
ncbi:rod shape-determining protein MreD [Poseidonocella pacifica]|uniref:Rod shape-determining protein MreD n=1 Tax=Poseidonocella pacifica TaxID=871651 RepID=A0A1I0XKZ6_9RHOB|nr:hypothetical protein [Poseidonocella pacifica]SFB01799.1 rod shape-determining protein MreD [Poseidonocella pacifica]